MDMRGALRARLLAAAPVTAIVSQRISWLTRPQAGALPALTLQVISGAHDQHLKGFEKQQSRVQIDAWATLSAEAAAIIAAVIDALAPGATVEGVQFGRGFFESEQDFTERLGEADIYRVSVDAIIRHKAA